MFPDDQRGLWALSCFAGGASLDGITHVLGALGVPSAAVIDTIGRLVDRSLITVEEVAGGEVRYRLLDSIRAYAADRLLESGQSDRAGIAWVQWYAEVAAWCDARVRTKEQPACLALARAERTNVDAVLAWCADHDPRRGTRIANDLGWTWVVLGDGTAGATRVRTALSDLATPEEQIRGRLLACWLEASAGDVALAEHDLDQAQRLDAELAGDDIRHADIARHEAFLAIQQGDPGRVQTTATRSLTTYRAHGEPWRAAGSLLLNAFGAAMRGDLPAATRAAAEAVGILSRLGDSWGLVHAQAILATIAQAERRFDDAAESFDLAANRAGDLGFLGQAPLHRSNLARVQHRAGEPEAAAETYRQAIEESVAVGDGRLAASTRLNLARLRRATGDDGAALALLAENERWYDVAGGGDFALLNRCILASVRDDAAALSAVLDESRANHNLEVTVQALDALARIDVANPDEARSLLAQADQLAGQVAHQLDAADRVDAIRARTLLDPSDHDARDRAPDRYLD